MPPTPVILREAEGEVAESTFLNELSLPGEEGPSKKVVEGRGRTLSQTPHLHFGNLLPAVKIFLQFFKCGFCNSGQALRAE